MSDQAVLHGQAQYLSTNIGDAFMRALVDGGFSVTNAKLMH